MEENGLWQDSMWQCVSGLVPKSNNVIDVTKTGQEL